MPITSDLYDIADRLREIDDRYEVMYDRVACRYTVYADGAPQFAAPFGGLDARTLELARKTRAERRDEILREIDESNRIAEARAVRAVAEMAAAAGEDLLCR